MKALGLIFDLSLFGKGKVFIKHTVERRQELLDKLTEILDAGVLTPKDAEALRGRIQWYESYLFGRIANLSIHRVGKRALTKHARAAHSLDEELRAALRFLKLRIDKGVPLELNATTEQTMLVFTDGACNEAGLAGSVGGILCDHTGTPLRYFSDQIPGLLLDQFLEEASNPIYLVELLAGVVSIFLWGGLFSCRYVVAYIDNEASRAALIKAYSSTSLGNVLVRMYVELEDPVALAPRNTKAVGFFPTPDCRSCSSLSALDL